jgi:acylphosphatase
VTECYLMQVHFSGRVQGVGFRYRVYSLATGYFVAGSVRNLADGRVELIAEGLRPELESFLEAVSRSDLAGHIRNMDVSWSPGSGMYKGFEIIR